MKLQWNNYSGATRQTKPSVPWIEVYPEWRLGWGWLLIKQQNKIFLLEPIKVSALAVYFDF